MAIWNKDNIMLTTKGARVLSKIQSGQGYLTVTRAVASSQTVLADNLSEVESLNPENLELAITGRRESGDGGSIILLQLSNLHLEQSFQLNEIGIFATHSEDPDNEFLYIIAQVDTGTGDRVPSYDITPVTATYDFYLYNLKSGDVKFEISATGLATVAQMNEAVSGLEKKDAELKAKIDANTEAINQLDTEGVNSAISRLNIPLLRSRVSQVEREQANLALKMEAEGMMPDCNMLLAENFENPDKIDRLTIKVKSCAAGDNSIDVESNNGVIVGSWYWITDGVHAEYLQVKSVIKNGDVYRILAVDNLRDTYTLEKTYIYRTTAYIDTDSGIVYGSGDICGFNWEPSKEWRGTGASTPLTIELETTLDKADNFDVDGDMRFTADGTMILGGN